MNAPVFQKTAFIPEIEQAVLGSMFFGAIKSDAAAILKDYHFVEPIHQHIFRALNSANERYSSSNAVVVKKLIPEDIAADFEKASGTSVGKYLAQLLEHAVSGKHLSIDASKRIIEQWARLSIANEAGRIYSAANDPSSDVVAISSDAARAFDDIMTEVRVGASKKTRSLLGDAVGIAIDAAAIARNSSGLTGITWGLADINKLTGGIHKRDLTLIGARPSMGKTTVAASVALKAAMKGHAVGFVSLEMDASKLAARVVSDSLYEWNVRIPYANIIRGTISDKDFETIVRENARINALPFHIDDQAGQSMSDIRSRAERLIEETERRGKRLEVLFIDHLGLIKASSRYGGNRVNEIAEITAGLKQLARDLDIAVVLLSQLNRAVETRENKRPMLSDLRDSGAIEQDADTIAFLYRDAYYLERTEVGSREEQGDRDDRLEECRNELEFIIAKQRNGELSTVKLFADMACSAVRNAVRV